MAENWLWDKNLKEDEIVRILKDELHPSFRRMAALLLARKNSAKEVFARYLDPLFFYKNWGNVKRVMRHDDWNSSRIEYWQAIYEKLKEKYQAQGIQIRKAGTGADKTCAIIGANIKKLRQRQKLTQDQLATKAGVTQQMLSKIEGGRENISILTIKKIARQLGCEIKLILKAK